MSQTVESANDVKPKKTTDLELDDPQENNDLEQRLKKLEDEMAVIRDTNTALEDRLLKQVRTEIQTIKVEKPSPKGEGITEQKKSSTPLFGNLFSQSKASSDEPPKAIPKSIVSGTEMVKDAWFLMDVWNEARTIFRMFFDIRYKMAWWVRAVVLGLLAILLFSHWFNPVDQIPIIGEFTEPFLDKIIALVLAFIVFKALSREVRRYLKWEEGNKQ